MAVSQAHVPITVSLKQETLAAIQSQVTDQPVADWMSGKARVFFENFVNGGILLTSEQVIKIEELAGKPVGNGKDVITAIGKSHGMVDGARTFLLSLDPTWVEPLKIRAAEMGRTPTDLINDMFSFALDGNWAMTLEANYLPPVYFPHYKAIQQLTGKDRPTGADIEAAIAELVKLAKTAPKAVEAAVA